MTKNANWLAPGVSATGLHRKAKAAAEAALQPGEQVCVVIIGASNQAVMGTQSRAFVFKKGFMAGASFGAEFTTWNYRHLVGVQIHTGMMSGAVVLQASGQSGASTSYWGTSNTDPFKAPNAIPIARPFTAATQGVNTLRHLIDLAHQPQSEMRVVGSQPAVGTSASVADELVKIASLRDAGVLTHDEFMAAKSRIIGGPTDVQDLRRISTEDALAEPGWYPDPAGGAGLTRYWDGATWTDHTSSTAT